MAGILKRNDGLCHTDPVTNEFVRSDSWVRNNCHRVVVVVVVVVDVVVLERCSLRF